MPIRFQTSLEFDLVYTHWAGCVNIDQFRETWTTYLSDVHYKPGRTELNDFTDVEKFEANFGLLWSALRMVNAQVPGKKVRTRTLLIVPGDVLYGLARIYLSLASNDDGIVVELYRSRDDAVAALGLGLTSLDDVLEKGAFLPHVSAQRSGT